MEGNPTIPTRAEHEWLEAIRASILHHDTPNAENLIARARSEYPHSAELRRCQAGYLQQNGDLHTAEALLSELLADDPADTAAAFALARLLAEQGRTAAAGATLRTCFADRRNYRDPDLAINAIELLDGCERKADAAAIASVAINENPMDARLHAYTSMLQMQLGQFARARQHYLYALTHDDRAWEWHIPTGLASTARYTSHEHPDFTLFLDALKRNNLSERSRAELHFALGKAYDDIGGYADAVCHFRRGNQIIHDQAQWSRKGWRRSIEARMATKPIHQHTEFVTDFNPVFVVGMPRSGTTLLAKLLSEYPRVRNRGELQWLDYVAERVDLTGTVTTDVLAQGAAIYAAHSRQDDGGDAIWFIDKQPLNFRYVDLILALFPQAKVIRSCRGTRDNALSLWTQCFTEGVQRYAYAFDGIMAVMRDEARLMAHWQTRYPDAVRDVRYEDLVTHTEAVLAELAGWIGLPVRGTPVNGDIASSATATISTASLWQARQPVYASSIGRWRHYAPYLPELLRFPDQP
jgi:hypothetical protein